jgi:uroporphyrin-III C-methyltransferase/precorrin-2 dehydrogenase/sirohydrochlorin ferrochelatase
MTPAFPVALKLTAKRCVVIGKNEEARARAAALETAGAFVTVVEDFSAEHLDGAWLAVLTDRDAALAERVAREAEARRVFFCAVDQPEVGSYSHVAITRAGPVFAAFGTQGEAPALARRLRELVEELFVNAGLGAFAARLAAVRKRTPPERRREVLNALVEDVRLEGKLVLPEVDDGP